MRIGWEHGKRGPGRSSRTMAAAPACPAMRGLCRTLLAGYLFAGTARAAGQNVYVAPTNAAAAAPYDTWAKAATNIQMALDYASAHYPGITIVTVSNGTYWITNSLTISKAITIRSFGNGVTGGLANARHTIVNGAGNHRVFYLGHSSAVLDGLTIRNGRNEWGAGVYMSAGLLKNCIVKDNSCDRGGGVYVGGNVVVANCVIRANASTGRGGAGAYGANANATFHNCEFTDNNHAGGEDDSGGGATYNDGGTFTFYNCLIARNRASNGGCAGCFNRGGGDLAFENCTVVSNRTTSAGYGAIRKRDAGNVTLRNSIVYFNADSSGQNNVQQVNGNADYSYTCTTAPDLAGTGMTHADPLFVDLAGGDYGLGAGSPCIDRGAVDPSCMAGATDLDGRGRIYQDVVDMGAFECWPRVPMIRNAGFSKVMDSTATVHGYITWTGYAEAAMFVCHGPADGGTNRQAWANEVRFPGTMNVGNHEVGISHKASDHAWFYRCFATNAHGMAWADFTGGLMLGAVDVKVTRRESTEEKTAAFVITRPATATNGPLDVYYALGGTGVNGVDYDRLDSPVVIPAGAAEVRLPVVPNFNMGESRPKGVELSLAPGGYRIGVNNKASMVTRAR